MVVNGYIDKFARCIVNGVTYSSDYNSSDRGSIVKAMFVLTGAASILWDYTFLL